MTIDSKASALDALDTIGLVQTEKDKALAQRDSDIAKIKNDYAETLNALDNTLKNLKGKFRTFLGKAANRTALFGKLGRGLLRGHVAEIEFEKTPPRLVPLKKKQTPQQLADDIVAAGFDSCVRLTAEPNLHALRDLTDEQLAECGYKRTVSTSTTYRLTSKPPSA